jgi:murein DD-endopeptidase MepM/ murein hydrolase activator NlpD
MLTSAAGMGLSTLQANPLPAQDMTVFFYFGPAVERFFNAFGALYFFDNALSGAAVLAVILVFSRYYAILSVIGYGAALMCLSALGAEQQMATTAWGSNAILAALLVGGLFAAPSWITAGLAALAAVFAAWLTLALGQIVSFAQLLPYSTPFVMAAWLVLYAALHNVRIASAFNLHMPDFPERTYVRSRMARARVGIPGSIPLALPFTGVWTVSQGFSGEHTHRGPWRHALDFVVLREGKSFTHRGSRLEDFYAYGLPVTSPAYGQVWQVVNHVPDNLPGTTNVNDNWGNFVLIRLSTGLFVLLAHLKPSSVVVQPGAWVQPGTVLAMCGNSGRSPQPHLHLHVQAAPQVGSPTAPFHLCSLISEGSLGHGYSLATVPSAGTAVWPAAPGEVRPLYVFAGRGIRYRISRPGMKTCNWSVHCELDALGRTVLVSSEGARCIAESTWAVFSCYERNDVHDLWFDLWLLANGYTPASTEATSWRDTCLPASLLPSRWARALAFVAWPASAFLTSTYQRVWDSEALGWRQFAQHRHATSGVTIAVESLLTAQVGCSSLSADLDGVRHLFTVASSFQHADRGVPGWESALGTA